MVDVDENGAQLAIMVRKWILRYIVPCNDDDFPIPVEHEVNVLVLATDARDANVETIVIDDAISSSFEDAGYDSAKDELYKLPLAGYEDDTESENGGSAGGIEMPRIRDQLLMNREGLQRVKLIKRGRK
ncbi:hypothetical protein PIB30_058214 [Stylosanthes scabra]|uniref:Uncharacterized protein n=1 Tax=Stylosanthes scabra TaxID=79078 RepID=A0ABU6RK71_9FABA|nr:hypothetical protein [Stylosanthes scabra]